MTSEDKMAVEIERLKVIRGELIKTPPEPPNFVRIFLSSTFHDFRNERDYLFNNVFPELDSWCRERGLEFQVVDLRWGIREGSSMEHSGAQMCLREVQNCQQCSIGPNFVAFLGSRYGRRPLPTEIPESEFSVILQNCSGTDKSLLTGYYIKDENAIPPVFILKSSNAKDNNNENNTEIIKDSWATTEAKLKSTLRAVVSEVNKRKSTTIDDTAAYKYFASVTEQEIWEGIIKAKDPEKHSICFIRKFQNYQFAKATAKYVDVLADGSVDEESKVLLTNLTNFLIPLKLDTNNIFNFNVPFDAESGVNADKHTKHRLYLKSLGAKLKENVRSQIVDGLKSISHRINGSDTVYKEVSLQAKFCESNCELYCGQEQLLSAVLEVLANVKPLGHNQPLVLHGISGCGKTATLAKIVQLASENYAHKYNLVYRFLGVTPMSGSIDNLLRSISDQISELYDLPAVTKSVEDYNSLRLAFLQLLQSVGETKSPYSLLVILDSIDQMSPAFDAFSMNWLPIQLPANVKVIISLNTRLERVIYDLQVRLKPDSFIEMSLLSNKDATNVLRSLLAKRQRTLQPSQWELVGRAFEKSQNPLLLELTFVEAAKWRSYTPPGEMKLGGNITEAINFLFDRLERDHGKVFVGHAVSYLVLAQNGLTELEMGEILSLDDAVMQDVYQYWKPPSDTEIGIPPLLWTRLREEIHEFIAVRQADDATVIRFYQKQFDEVVLQRYLNTTEAKVEIYGNLAEYFMGIWSHKPKPITLRISGKLVDFPNAMRMCSKQPIQFGTGPGARFNLRKLNELPHHLYHAGKFDSLITETLVNYPWLHAKHQAVGLHSVISDFDLYATPLKHPPLGYIQQTLRLALPTLEFQTNEDSLAKELLCRLYNLGPVHKRIGMLLDGAKNHFLNCVKTEWEPLNQYAQSPKSSLITTLIGHTAGINHIAASSNFGRFASVCGDKTLRIWNTQAGKLLHYIKLSDETMLVHLAEEKVLVIFRYGGGEIYDSKTGFLLSKITEENLPVSTLNLHSSPTHTIAIPTRSQIEVVAETYLHTTMPNSQILAVGHTHTLRFYDIQSAKIVRIVDTIRHVQFLNHSDSQLIVGLEPNILAFFTTVDTHDKDLKYAKFQQLIWAESIADNSCLLLAGNLGNRAYLHVDKSMEDECEPIEVLNESAAHVVVYDRKLVCIAGKITAAICMVSDNSANLGDIDVLFDLHCPSQISLVRFLPDPNAPMPLIAIGSVDEMMRIYAVNTKVPKFVLPAIWGGPTCLLVDRFTLITASSGAPYLKIWDLNTTKSEGTVGETPIHVENFNPMPSYLVQTQLKEENSFIVASVDVDGNLLLSDANGPRQRLEFCVRYESQRLLFLQLISVDRLMTGWAELPIDSIDETSMCSLVKIHEISLDKAIVKEVFATKLQSDILHWSNNCSLTNASLLLTRAKEVLLFDTRSHSLRKIMNATAIFDDETVQKIFLCKDNFAVSNDDCISVFNLKGKMLCRLLEPRVTVFVMRKNYLAMVNRSSTAVKVFNVGTKVPLINIDLPNHHISSIALSEDLKFVYFGTVSDKSAHQYEIESGLKVRRSYMYAAVVTVDIVKDLLVVITKLGNFCLHRVHQRNLPKEKRSGKSSISSISTMATKRSRACNIM